MREEKLKQELPDKEESCSCGHEHDEHDHPEHHDHVKHEHHHEHDHCCENDDDDDCCCGHEHHHLDHDGHEHYHHHGADSQVFILENLGCAHCAAKMEEKISHLPGVTAATITFATKQLRVSGENAENLLPEIEKICTSIESEVKVIPKKKPVSGTSRTSVYILENLGCAHCAAKMEERICNLEGIDNAVITFATKQLRVTAAHPEQYLDDISKICSSIESEVKVTLKEELHKREVDSAAIQNTGKKSEQKKELTGIIAGAALFVLGVVFNHIGLDGIPAFVVFVIAYIILGGKVLLQAAKNISHGQIFDENFLMAIATIGAFCIQEFPEAVGVMLFYRIGDFFEEKAVEKSRSQIMDAVDMRPEVVSLVNHDTIRVIPAEDAMVGDILLIHPGDRIPLDGVIVEGESRLDTSPITGEPVPVAVNTGDRITSGCVNTSGQLKIRVEKILSESMVTRILDSVENAAAGKPKIDRFITRFAKVYTPIVVIAALAIAIIPSLFSGNWYYWIYTALTFLVMSCPCALVLSVPLAFFSGIGAGSRKGILFKGGLSMESLSRLGAVVMDKTGTITEGNFKLRKIVTTGSYTEDELLTICAGCEANSTHPIAASITASAKERRLTTCTPVSLQEIPGHGIAAETENGTVLCGNRKLMEKYNISVPQLPNDTYGAEVFAAVNGSFAGYMIISDTIKSDAESSVSRLKSFGLHTVMLTGDSENSAQAVAAKTGIDEVHARLLPQDKLDLLSSIRKEHGAVMFIGDGINDAPVLAGADVGAAMGNGADAAIEAADAVFMTSSVDSIPQAIKIAKGTNRIAIQNVVIALAIKIFVMILGLTGHANMWMAVFADTGVAIICVLNSIRALYIK